MKKVYQNIVVEPVDLSKGQIRVRNEHFFKDLSAYTLHWTIKANGDSVGSGKIKNIDVPPRGAADTVLSYEQPTPKPGIEYFLTIQWVLTDSTRWAPAGYEVASNQFRLPSSTSRSPLVMELSNQEELSIDESTTAITISGGDFEVIFDRLAGTISSFTHNGNELVARGPMFNAWRPITDNDQSGWGVGDHYTSKWYDARLPDLAHRVRGITSKKISPKHVRVIINVEMTEPGNARPVFETSYYYNILANGEVALGQTVAPAYDFEGVGLPRLGLQMEVPKVYDTFTWFGRGPFENYHDRNTAAYVDRYQASVADQYFPYVRPQATGNKTGVRWAALTDADGSGLQIMAGPSSLKDSPDIAVFPDTTDLSGFQGGSLEVTALLYTTENR